MAVTVAIDQIWEFVGRETKPSPYRFHRVLRPNVGTEAGADSWVMARSDGDICYMHHRACIAGDWVCVRYGGNAYTRNPSLSLSLLFT